MDRNPLLINILITGKEVKYSDNRMSRYNSRMLGGFGYESLCCTSVLSILNGYVFIYLFSVSSLARKEKLRLINEYNRMHRKNEQQYRFHGMVKSQSKNNKKEKILRSREKSSKIKRHEI